MTPEMLRAFFGWGALCNLVILTAYFLLLICLRDWIYALHRRWFNIAPQTIDAILYGAMAGYKLATILLFVTPYLVLRFLVP